MWGTEKLLPVNKDDNMATEEWNFSDVNVVINKAVEIPKKEKNELKHDYDDRCMNIIMKSIANSLPNKYRGVYEQEGFKMKQDRKSTRLNSSHRSQSRMPSSA